MYVHYTLDFPCSLQTDLKKQSIVYQKKKGWRQERERSRFLPWSFHIHFTGSVPLPPIGLHSLVSSAKFKIWSFNVPGSVPLSPIGIRSLVSTFSWGANMSFTGPSMASGARTGRRTLEFGRTYVVRPKGKHQATVVWLHGLGDNGSSWSQLLETLPLPNIKWICPTAPTQPVTVFGGFPSTAWFDIGDLSEDGPDDVEGLDAAAAHVANLLSTEPAEIKLGIGGFSMGAATSLYSATCFARGKYANNNSYPANLSAVVGLSGWLPCSKTLQIAGNEVAGRAASLPILLCHGKCDDVVPFKYGEKSSRKLSENGCQDVKFTPYHQLGHFTIPEEMDEVCTWLTSKLGLEGSSSR